MTSIHYAGFVFVLFFFEKETAGNKGGCDNGVVVHDHLTDSKNKGFSMTQLRICLLTARQNFPFRRKTFLLSTTKSLLHARVYLLSITFYDLQQKSCP